MICEHRGLQGTQRDMPDERIDFEAATRTYIKAALDAGGIVMMHYRNLAGVETKPDESPVTAADREAESCILRHLAADFPDVPVVAEESVSAGRIPQLSGGTKEFIQGRTDFTVNIALIVDGRPTVGVVYCPALDALYWSDGTAARLARAEPGADPDSLSQVAKLAVRTPPDPMTAVASRSHRDAETDAYLAERGITDCVSRGSSMKFCVVAEGNADIYPRFGPTMEWDIAAGHAVLAAAGGRVELEDGRPFTYGKQDAGFRNPGFIAFGGGS